MSTYIERRMEVLAQRLKSRTQRDGKPMPGYEQNVAMLKAEMAQLTDRQALKDIDNG